MPKYYEEDYEQDWEAVILTKEQKKQDQITGSSFGFRLAEARRHADFTQKSLAQSMNISVILLEKWEANESIPTNSQLVRLKRVLRQKIYL